MKTARVIIFGAGVQGTIYGVRLANAGHDVRFVARATRAKELAESGAIIENAFTGSRAVSRNPEVTSITESSHADFCFVTVRREQLEEVVSTLAAAEGIARVVLMVNHANGSEGLIERLGRERMVLAFPGMAGEMRDGIVRYVEVAEQRTAIDALATDVTDLLKSAGFRVSRVEDMDSWLRRHAVFITAIGGALYDVDLNARRLASDDERMLNFVAPVRESWREMDRRGVAHAPFALRTIFQLAPPFVSSFYWRRFLASPKAEYYFRRHTSHAPAEMSALAADLRDYFGSETPPSLERLFKAIDQATAYAAASSPMLHN